MIHQLSTTNRIARPAFLLLFLLFLVGCAQSLQYRVPQSVLAAGDSPELIESDEAEDNVPQQVSAEFERLTPLKRDKELFPDQKTMTDQFPDDNALQISAEKMPGQEFIHTIFGKLLDVNYVIAEETRNLDQPVTLNIQQSLSSKALFILVAELLNERDISISLRDEVFFIHAKDPRSKDNTIIGFGRNQQDVPRVSGQIVQIVPVRYGISAGFERTLRDLTDAKISPDLEQSAVYITAQRSEVLRVIDLITLLDTPASRGRNVGILRLTYISPDEFTDKVSTLLESEGLPADVNRPGRRNLVMVTLDQLGAVALFAADELYIERVQYWARQLDQPGRGVEKRYFVYNPRFARASDLGESVAALLGQSTIQNRSGNRSRDTASAMPEVPAPSSPGSLTASNEAMVLTVDERSNSLIFFSAGKDYQALLPMIKRLDIMPKQILLEATIAEVTLTDEFRMGLEFALESGKLNIGTAGAFGVAQLGGLSLSYVNGLDRIIANLQATDSRVNVLSNPSLVVRDGVTASINVGSQIPTVGTTTINPATETQSTVVVYRDTGVNLSVTPTINAQGLVVMEISQNISNTLDGGSGLSGSPAFFNRSIDTEVIAQSGQTVLLGGLISENKTFGKSKVAGLGDIPILGALFRSESETVAKTELVILITPKVIDSTEQWQDIRAKLAQGMQYLELDAEENNN